MDLTNQELAVLLDRALGALADIALADDLAESQRRHKANRVYHEIITALERPSTQRSDGDG